MNLILKWLINALAVFIAAYILPGVGVRSFWAALVVALVLGVVNILVKPLLVLLTLPVTIVTLGLFLFVINALMIMLAARLVDGFYVAGFGWALLFSLLLSLLNTLLRNLVDTRSSNDR